jgi:hypothetical protein
LDISLNLDGGSRRENNVNIKELIGAYALLDLGSLAGDFISSRILVDLDRMTQNKCIKNFVVDRPYTLPVCSGLDSVCTNISAKSVILNVSFWKNLATMFVTRFLSQLNFVFCLRLPLI